MGLSTGRPKEYPPGGSSSHGSSHGMFLGRRVISSEVLLDCIMRMGVLWEDRQDLA